MMDLFIAKVNGNKLGFGLSKTDKPKPILWINQGLYALIPIEVVKDEMRVAVDKAKFRDDQQFINLYFVWDQAIEIPPEAGRILANEQTRNS